MATFKISTLEKTVMSNFKSFGADTIPSKMLSLGSNPINSNQVNAVINNMVAKGLVVRHTDLFGSIVQLTRSGKIRATKFNNQSMGA